MKEWKDDKALFALIKEELDTAGFVILWIRAIPASFLPPASACFFVTRYAAAGRAMTVLEADVLDAGKEKGEPGAERSFGLMLEALDDLKEDEAYVCSGSSPAYALWGELMSARAIQCKAAGAVVNGYSRDTKGILALDFPCFSYGPYAQDQAPRGKLVIDYQVLIEMEGVMDQ
ncbi:MAG: RraA family protein [Parabacteroides merdae]